MPPVLVLIDAQKNMLEPPEPVPAAVEVGKAIEEVLARARAAGAQVVHVRNNGPAGDPDEPGTPGWELVHEVRDGEHVVDKYESDSFAGTALADLIPPGAPLVLIGMQSDYCILATSLSALRRGHRVSLVRGAHATYDDGDVSAETVSRQVEDELARAGVALLEREHVTF